MLRIVWLISALISISLDLSGEEVRDIAWGDLLPSEEEPFDDPFLELSEDQLLDLGMRGKLSPAGACVAFTCAPSALHRVN